MKHLSKKSILGLNTVKAFVIVMLSLAIIGVITLVVLSSIANSYTTPMRTTAVTNVSTTKVMNASTNYVVATTLNCNLVSITNLTNQSGYVCNSGNYSVSGCTITPLATASIGCNNTVWYITGSYGDTEVLNTVNGNVSAGITNFFTNATTYFSLLGVVVIILIISLVVVVVNRFGGESIGGRESNPSL